MMKMFQERPCLLVGKVNIRSATFTRPQATATLFRGKEEFVLDQRRARGCRQLEVVGLKSDREHWTAVQRRRKCGCIFR